MTQGPETIDSALLPDDVLEAHLRQALCPEQPRAGFTDCVMAAALAGVTVPVRPRLPAAYGRLLAWPARNTWAAGAAAAVLALAISLAGGSAAHARWQHERAQEATRNFDLATRIEEQALEHTRQQLRQAGVVLER